MNRTVHFVLICLFCLICSNASAQEEASMWVRAPYTGQFLGELNEIDTGAMQVLIDSDGKVLHRGLYRGTMIDPSGKNSAYAYSSSQVFEIKPEGREYLWDFVYGVDGDLVFIAGDSLVVASISREESNTFNYFQFYSLKDGGLPQKRRMLVNFDDLNMAVSSVDCFTLPARKTANGRYGYFDLRKQAWLIEPKFEKAHRFSDGLAIVQLADAIGYVNYEGDFHTVQFASEVGSPRRDSLELHSGFSNRRAWVKKGNGDFALINKAFKEIALKADIKPLGAFSDGLAPFWDGVKREVGFLNTNGEVVVDKKYRSVRQNFCRGVSVVQLHDGQDVLIDKAGKTLFEIPLKKSFSTRIIRIIDNGLVYLHIGDSISLFSTKLGKTVFSISAAEAQSQTLSLIKEKIANLEKANSGQEKGAGAKNETDAVKTESKSPE